MKLSILQIKKEVLNLQRGERATGKFINYGTILALIGRLEELYEYIPIDVILKNNLSRLIDTDFLEPESTHPKKKKPETRK